MKQLCSVCHENEAVIFVHILAENREEKKGLCPSCAVKYLQQEPRITNLDIMDKRLLEVIEEMKDLLSGIVSGIGEIVQIENEFPKNQSITCPSCGISYEDFSQTGLLGCPQCYETFRETLDDFALELHRGPQHRGKMPKAFARLYVLKKEISFLTHQLERLIHIEEYEKAAKVRKKLERLIGKRSIGREDENH